MTAPKTPFTYAGGPRPSNAPRRKSLEFENFKFIFDYTSSHLYVEEIADIQAGTSPRQIRFSKDELEEFRAALKSFGLEVPDPNIVNYRDK